MKLHSLLLFSIFCFFTSSAFSVEPHRDLKKLLPYWKSSLQMASGGTAVIGSFIGLGYCYTSKWVAVRPGCREAVCFYLLSAGYAGGCLAFHGYKNFKKLYLPKE